MDMQKMMQQARAMQADVKRIQKELAETEVTGTAKGEAVSATVTGDKRMKAIRISPDAVNPNDVEALEKLVASAVDDALEKAEKLAKGKMAKASGGLGNLF